MTFTTDELITEEDSGRPLSLERAFALELLADPDRAAGWVTTTDQADLPARLLQWARAVADGIPRSSAPYWYDASPAFTRWLDARDGMSAPRSSAVTVGDAPRARTPARSAEDDLRLRVESLEHSLEGALLLLNDLAAFTKMDPARYEGLQSRVEVLRRAINR